MAFRAIEFKVGFLVIAVACLIAWMSFKVSEGPGLFGGGTIHHFIADDAGGLIERGAVKIAGIKVGLIKKIELQDGKAKVYIHINKGVKLRQGAYVTVKADGILGDKHVEIRQGLSSSAFVNGSTQLNFQGGGGSIDSIASEVGKITGSLTEFVKTLNGATGEGSEDTRLGRILKNMEDLSTNMKDMTEENKGGIKDLVTNLKSVTSRMDHLLDDRDGKLNKAWNDVQEIIHRFDNTMTNFESISYKVNDGTGTLGQLVNDDSTITSINQTIENVNEFVGNAVELQTSIDYHSEFMSEKDRNKNYLSLKITPGLDRYYEIGVIDDPTGVSSTTRTVNTGSTTTDVTESKTFLDKVKFTALFAKNVHNFTLKGGIIENRGGLGIDYHLLNKDLRLSIEAFDFKDVYLRSFVRYNVFNGFYLTVGGDNLLSNRDSDISAFVGAGLFLTNDDLKILATRFSF